ncbi:hypothetical protein [Sphingopyxis sp. LC81]|uniref:hypothetical protein n=1 Tax=Sphingopyxis sp. LC81 TaxID=1502850 RepID=UPI0013780F95|nr:hypothetical protein [Sphingopyxis sp. LC81]
MTEFCKMLGVQKTKAYEILPGVKSVKIGRRRLVCRRSAKAYVKNLLSEGEQG